MLHSPCSMGSTSVWPSAATAAAAAACTLVSRGGKNPSTTGSRRFRLHWRSCSPTRCKRSTSRPANRRCASITYTAWWGRRPTFSSSCSSGSSPWVRSRGCRPGARLQTTSRPWACALCSAACASNWSAHAALGTSRNTGLADAPSASRAGNHSAALRASRATKAAGTPRGSWCTPSGSAPSPSPRAGPGGRAHLCKGHQRLASTRSTPKKCSALLLLEGRDTGSVEIADISEAGVGLHRARAVLRRGQHRVKTVAGVEQQA